MTGFQKITLMISAVLGITLLISLAQHKVACGQSAGCCCTTWSGETCCTYDIYCDGCPCAL
jgi:hypothetical protein